MTSTFQNILNEQDFETTLYNAGMFFVDYSRDYGQMSKVCRELGFQKSDLTDCAYQERIHPDDLVSYLGLWVRFNRGYDDELYCEYRLRDLRGEWNWVLTHATALGRYKDGRISKIIGFDRIINSRKKTEELLLRQLDEAKRKNEIADAVMSAGRLMIHDVPLSENLYEGMEKLRGIVRYDYCALVVDENYRENTIFSPPGDRVQIPDLSSLIHQIRESGYPLIDETGDGGSLMAFPLTVDGAYLGAIVLISGKRGFFDGSDLYPVQSFARIFAIAIQNHHSMKTIIRELERDQLTGFLTRRSFDLAVRKSRKELGGEQKEGMAFCMLDIDHFKRVNDRFGHQTGDLVISQLACICQRALRDQDLLGRYGGEEFIIVLRNAGLANAEAIMNRIRVSIENCVIPEISGGVTVSIGISFYITGDTIETVIERADKALYRGKRAGRNRVVAES